MTLEPDHQRTVLRELCKLAMKHISEVPEAARPDIYEGVAIAASGADPVMSARAEAVARDLRAAMASQLEFSLDLQA